MRRRFSGLNFIQFVYIDYITCTFIILYGQECLNHGGSNSIQGGNRKFLGCTQWSPIELEICWKYVLYEYTVTPSLLNSILSDPNAWNCTFSKFIWTKFEFQRKHVWQNSIFSSFQMSEAETMNILLIFYHKVIQPRFNFWYSK